MEKYYQLVQDNDCHWYVIPVNKLDEWNEWIVSEEYYDGTVPLFADDVRGSLHCVQFKNYKILD